MTATKTRTLFCDVTLLFRLVSCLAYSSTPKEQGICLSYCHAYEFGLVIGFIAHLYNSLLHFTNNYRTQTSVLCLLQSPLVVSW
jgi:hypothetical protein